MPNEMYTNTGHVFDTSKAMHCTLVYVLGSFRQFPKSNMGNLKCSSNSLRGYFDVRYTRASQVSFAQWQYRSQ